MRQVQCIFLHTKKHILLSLFQDIFQALWPPFCAAVCHCCDGLVCTLYTGGLCAFPCLSPCSHSNLLPDSLPLPLSFSAWPVVAMPPHHTVIVRSLMATMIRVPAAGRLFICWLRASAFTLSGMIIDTKCAKKK